MKQTLAFLTAALFAAPFAALHAASAAKPNLLHTQLYDLESDRAQSRNIIREHPEQAALMAKHLAELQQRPGAKPSSEAPMERRKKRKRVN